MNTPRSIWLAALVALGLFASTGAAKELTHPSHFHHALHELREARHELREAKHDFGGHKKEALIQVDHAIHHLEKIVGHPHHKLHVANTKPHANNHSKHHSHIHHALHELKVARNELKDGKHDYGGQKEAALRDMTHAIHQLELVVQHHKK